MSASWSQPCAYTETGEEAWCFKHLAELVGMDETTLRGKVLEETVQVTLKCGMKRAWLGVTLGTITALGLDEGTAPSARSWDYTMRIGTAVHPITGEPQTVFQVVDDTGTAVLEGQAESAQDAVTKIAHAVITVHDEQDEDEGGA